VLAAANGWSVAFQRHRVKSRRAKAVIAMEKRRGFVPANGAAKDVDFTSRRWDSI